jgi:hypothetical protein
MGRGTASRRLVVEGYGGGRRGRAGTPPSAACGVCHLPICRFAENREDQSPALRQVQQLAFSAAAHHRPHISRHNQLTQERARVPHRS